MEYEYLYDKNSKRIEINDSNFMVPSSLPALDIELMFKNKQYITEVQKLNLFSFDSEKYQGSSAVFICYLYACNTFAGFLEETDENIASYRNLFRELSKRILFFAQHSNLNDQKSCIESLDEVAQFKKLPNRVKWLFLLSINSVQSICSGCFKNPSFLLKKHKELHKFCSHEFYYANNFLNQVFTGILYSHTKQNMNELYKIFWRI